MIAQLYIVPTKCYCNIVMPNTFPAAIGFTIHTKLFGFSKFPQFHKYLNQYQPCLYLFDAFPMVIPNIVMKFNLFESFENCVNIQTCRLLTPAAWRLLSRVSSLHHHRFPLSCIKNQQLLMTYDSFYSNPVSLSHFIIDFQII